MVLVQNGAGGKYLLPTVKVTNQSLSLEKPLTSSYSSVHKSFEDRLELTVACPEGGIQASVDSNAMTMSTWTQLKLAGFIS